MQLWQLAPIFILPDPLHLFGKDPNQVEAQGVAKWDGSQWHSLSPYPNFWTMLSLTSHGSDIYAGGNVGYLDKWDGTQWTSVGGGTNGYEGVKAMTFIGIIFMQVVIFTQAEESMQIILPMGWFTMVTAWKWNERTGTCSSCFRELPDCWR